MRRTKVQSSWLRAVSHNKRTKEMRVTFSDGTVGKFANVPPTKAEAIVTAPQRGESAGKVFNGEIRKKPQEHPYTKLQAPKGVDGKGR